MKKFYLTFLLFLPLFGLSQSYFPPTSGSQWDSLAPANLGWCQNRIDSLYQFLEDKNSKSFIILKDGHRVLEKYFGTFTRDSLWYWASAGKSLAAFLVGMAQEQGHLDINDPVSDYLGQGWTATTPTQEAEITIRHQISMTTGLDYWVPDPNCLLDTCLSYRAEPDSQWFYHNAPYRLVQDVVDSATGMRFWQYTAQQLGNRIGMGGIWFDYVRYGKARDMARFGLLVLNKGVWDGDTLLADSAYFHAMTNTSNLHNASYGYLWWLNGKGSYIPPGLPWTFPGDIIPNAPADMICALGKNDQKIYVAPGQGLVVVRQGNAADTSALALTGFDNDLWDLINNLDCATALEKPQPNRFHLFPNPISEHASLTWESDGQSVQAKLYGMNGKLWGTWEGDDGEMKMDLAELPAGLYFLRIRKGDDIQTSKILKP